MKIIKDGTFKPINITIESELELLVLVSAMAIAKLADVEADIKCDTGKYTGTEIAYTLQEMFAMLDTEELHQEKENK